MIEIKGHPKEHGIHTGKLRTFVPAKDFEVEKNFYLELGFTPAYSDQSMIVFEIGEQSFYLQNQYFPEWADNFMMFLQVDNVDNWYAFILDLNLTHRFPGARAVAPIDEHWGRVCRLITPTGVLWHFGTFREETKT